MSAWRILLCNLQGTALSDISSIAYNRKYTETLNQPSSFSFSVDPSDPKIATVHTDGAPYLDYIRRTVRAYRKELQSDGTYLWVLRFNGFVWPIQDTGDEDGNTDTAVTCFDPMIMFTKRLCRDATSGSYLKVAFNATDPSGMIRTLNSTSAARSGPFGLNNIGSGLGMAAQSVEWSNKLMSEALNELTQGFDVRVLPVTGTASTVGSFPTVADMGTFEVLTRRGTTRTTALGWRYAPNNLATIGRIMDPSDAVNVLVGVGSGDVGVVAAVDSTSISNYLQLEGVTTLPDSTTATYLNNWVASQLYDRLPQQEAVSIGTGDATEIRPWVDFETGDTVSVTAHPALRGGVLRTSKRIFGWSMDISDEDDETINFVTEREGGT